MTSAADDIIDLYERHAAAWAAVRAGPVFESLWLDHFKAFLPDAGSVLDIGCGSADPLARYLLQAGYAVDGIDSSPSLVSVCRNKFPSRSWMVSDMRELNLGRSFDGLLAWHSLFHLTPSDQAAMFPIFRRHAHSGTALMFTSGPAFGETIGQWCGEPLYHGSLAPDDYRRLLAMHGFDLVRHVANDRSCGHATVWLARAR